MKIAIIINKNRITPQLNQELNGNALREKYNLQYDLFLPSPQEITKVLRSLNFQSYNACLIGGGDGTVRAAAQEIIGQNIPLIILPLGTFNLLAKELNYPNNIEEIFKIIKNNKTKQIDLAEVNGLIIINHAWIGFYYYILKMRAKHKNVLGKNKFFKTIFNFYGGLFKSLPLYDLEVKTNEERKRYKTCLIFIGNNAPYTNILDFGDRKSLTSGLLSVTILNCITRWQLFLSMLSIAFNKFSETQYVTEFQTDALIITAKRSPINIVIDGELFKLESPLHFINHQKKLMVFVV